MWHPAALSTTALSPGTPGRAGPPQCQLQAPCSESWPWDCKVSLMVLLSLGTCDSCTPREGFTMQLAPSLAANALQAWWVKFSSDVRRRGPSTPGCMCGSDWLWVSAPWSHVSLHGRKALTDEISQKPATVRAVRTVKWHNSACVHHIFYLCISKSFLCSDYSNENRSDPHPRVYRGTSACIAWTPIYAGTRNDTHGIKGFLPNKKYCS